MSQSDLLDDMLNVVHNQQGFKREAAPNQDSIWIDGNKGVMHLGNRTIDLNSVDLGDLDDEFEYDVQRDLDMEDV